MQAFLGAASVASVPGLLATHVNIAMYAFAYWLQQPVLPFISSELGASAATFGLLQSVFSGAQLLGGPVMGTMADSLSPRAILAISLAAGGVSYGLLALTHSLPMLFASKLPSAAMHAMMAAQACVSTLSTPEARAQALGRLSLSYGLGMVAGSALGGSLTRVVSLHTVAGMSAAVSFATVAATYQLLPDKVGGEGRRKEAEDKDAASPGLGASLKLMVSPALAPVMLFVAAVGLALSMQRATFSMMAKDAFGLSSEELGWTMSYGALLGLVVNVVIVPLLTSVMSEIQTSIAAAALLALGFAGYGSAASLADIVVVLVPLTVASATLYTVTTALISNVVPAELVGSAIGLRHGLGSLLGVVAPALASAILAASSPAGLAYVCAGLAAAAAVAALVARA
ncbi:solute carrier family 22 member 18 [Thecamonas trahens ATCC 50062]|uniref:Solute carrier family 22 member 18 n=1 Tax=Thecamonas trahens ATCC 50062 TaxID=461836 RepID=A0A0L0DW52_THETB|nr:solute carrier family 22 member 18 [Thecamonas trahens ATCC 50062]KNC56445.1 solute carrier family 22 member 18 [Thecamonas trahens ATCC 50062]|eukprot:XP_013760957.1 solute carrier family 22 member 18 [Thecamonas trahens ATCC 50062]